MNKFFTGAVVLILILMAARPAAAVTPRIVLYPNYLYALGPLRLAPGRVLGYTARREKVRCQLHNAGKAALTFLPGAGLDLASIPSVTERQSRFHDWDFRIGGTDAVIHCEYPAGADRSQVHPRLHEALAGVFGFRRVRPVEVDRNVLAMY